MIDRNLTTPTYPVHFPGAFQARRAGAAMIAGGVFWIAHYLWQIVSTLSVGKTPDAGGPFYVADGVSLLGGIVLYDVALLLLGGWLRARAGGWAVAGTVFALLAGAAAITGAALRILGTGPAGLFAGNGVIATCIAATLLGIGAVRSAALPRPQAWLLLLIGALTFPLILLLWLPSIYGFPGYLTDELPFAMSGAAWIVLGLAALRAGGR